MGRHLNKTFTREGIQSDEIKIDELCQRLLRERGNREGTSKRQTSGRESIQTWLHPTTAGVWWEICNIKRISSDGQTIAGRVQNCKDEDGETKREEGRVELSLLVFNLGAQCYILSMDDSMSIQQACRQSRERKDKSGWRTMTHQPTINGNGNGERRLATRAPWRQHGDKRINDHMPASSHESGRRTTTQQPTIDGNGKGGWRLATRAPGGSVATRESTIAGWQATTKAGGGQRRKNQPLS